MSSFFVFDDLIGSGMTVGPDLFVTVAGTVRAPNGAGIVRSVAAFNDGDLTRQLGQGDSTTPLGAFSFSVVGMSTSKITVIAKSEGQENSVIYARCSVVGGGSGYTPPPIDNIPFIVGNGDTTSPYCDIYHPMSSIESEVVNANVINADFGLMSSITSEVVNPILIDCSINPPMLSISGYLVNYRMIDCDINHRMSSINADVMNAIVIDVNIRHRMSSISADMGADVTINHPMSSISSVVYNPNVISVDLYHKMSSINAAAEVTRLNVLALNTPAAMFSMDGAFEKAADIELLAPAAMFSFEGSSNVNELEIAAPAAMFNFSNAQTEKYGVVQYIRGEVR